jgi:hypothetical protein
MLAPRGHDGQIGNALQQVRIEFGFPIAYFFYRLALAKSMPGLSR